MNLNRAFPIDSNGHPVPCSQSTGLVPLASAPKSIVAGGAVLVDCLLYTDGTNDATLTIYDSPNAANGIELCQVIVKGAELWGGEVNIMCQAAFGLYMTLTGNGSKALVRHMPAT